MLVLAFSLFVVTQVKLPKLMSKHSFIFKKDLNRGEFDYSLFPFKIEVTQGRVDFHYERTLSAGTA